MQGGAGTLVGVLIPQPVLASLLAFSVLAFLTSGTFVRARLPDQFDTFPGNERCWRALRTLASATQQPRGRETAHQSQRAIINTQHAPVIGKTDIVHAHSLFMR